jgi:hypothetical protein
MGDDSSNNGKGIDYRQDNIEYIDHECAVWLTDKVDADLIHPRDGSAYALSYHLQRRINNMSGGNKPKILITGHYHKFFMMFFETLLQLVCQHFNLNHPS